MYDNSNIFSGAIDVDGTIYMVSLGRNRQKVGIGEQREKELLAQIEEQAETLENYYNKLVELKVIVPPKTAEQIALEQAEQQKEINMELLKAIDSLKSEISSMKNSEKPTVAKSETVEKEPSKKTSSKSEVVKND